MSDWVTLKNTLGLQLRPIGQWPQPPTRDREAGPFRSTLGATLKLVSRELRMLNARSIVLQIAIREGGFRLDGLPRADARTEHPGVILSFECSHGPLLLPCDTFRNWQDNLRAIAMHLENLRHAGLYGVGRRGEQYRGWKQLPAGGEADVDPGDLSPTDAARHLGMVIGAGWGPILESAAAFEAARRSAVRLAHPDQGGSQGGFLRVQAAVAVLRMHHGL